MIEADAQVLAERLRVDFPNPHAPSDWVWSQPPAVRVTDCVLSLRKNYIKVVLPRMKAFADRFPGVTTCQELCMLIGSYPTPLAFHIDALRMDSPGKAIALVAVIDYLIDIQQRFEGATEEDRLTQWARWARPGDHLMLGIDGFKLAGFQYLRMLFRAETVNPDVHILRYVETVLKKPIAGNASAGGPRPTLPAARP